MASALVPARPGDGMAPQQNEWEFRAEGESQTRQLGRRLAACVIPGTVVALIGDLGAGKTRFVQAITESLGVDRRDIRSPTFVLVHEYHGTVDVFHVDAYRLRDVDEFQELGADEFLFSDGLCLIEWADRVADALPADRLQIEIKITGSSTRLFRFLATGARSRHILERLRSAGTT